MYATPTQFAELQKTQIDAFNSLGHTAFNAAEKLVNLNLAATRAVLQESADAVQSLLGAKDVQEWVALSSGLTQPAIEKVVSYSRNVYGIASGANAEVTKIVEAQIADGNRKLAEMVDFAAKNAPTGSEPAVSFFKSAAAAANTAFDTFSKAAKQASDWAESNFAAAANATVSAAAAANDAVKAKTKKVA
ncbi:MAG TPA: phasin family protein [Burkholderiaceae bacterium]|nr:phasin family protein [Burkholderiaceae bacterium]